METKEQKIDYKVPNDWKVNVIYCETYEEAKEFANILHDLGDEKYDEILEKTRWMFGENGHCCYKLNSCGYTIYRHVADHNHRVIDAKDFINLHKKNTEILA